MALTTYLHQAPKLKKKSRAIVLLPLWAFSPILGGTLPFTICWIREIGGGGGHFTLNAMKALTGSTLVAQVVVLSPL